MFAVIYIASSSISFAAADEDITISANTSWSAGTYTYRDITITNNAILTLNGAYTTDSDGSGVTINARNITVASGSSITATGKGYAAGAGTGKGATAGMFGSGGSHGGKGGVSATGTASGPIYDLVTNPSDLGSGGNVGAGGGAIILNLSGNLASEGNITANGTNGGSYTGGGAGGTIKINAVDISGAGTIAANGGNGGASGGGGGGGGRVAIYHTGTNSKNTAVITAAAGTGNLAGAIGSVFLYDKTNKDSTIFSNLIFGPSEGINVSGDPSTDGIYNFRNLTVNNNAILYDKIRNSTDSDGVGIELRLTGDLTVATGSRIDGIGLGYGRGVGEGKATGQSDTYGGGAAHGGAGGRGEIGVGGTQYDSTLFPVKPGSGGYTTKGGQGGSAIKITAVDLVIDGSINQSASAPTGDGATNGSGGAGGSIYIVAATVSGTGTIKADATNGYGYSGGGGGGRIAIYADTSGFTPANITAAKGTKGGSGYSADGVVGTVFLYDTTSGNVSASSDVTFDANQGVNRDGSLRTDGVFYFNNLTVSNNATITIGGYYTNDTDGRGVTLNLDGNLTIDSGSKISSTAQGYAGNAGQGKGAGAASASGSGGSYGGLGGISYSNSPTAVYDATKANYPSALGSGGGSGTGVGGKGGGAVALRVLGNVVNNGEIVSDGAPGTGGASSWRPGGGSGGSVFINADSLSGAGIVTAKGGAGLGDTNFGSGGGGGGRISVVYSGTQTLPLANFSTAGGAGGGSSARNGAEGSVNITQRILPAAEFALKNPNNNSTEFTNTENVEIVPADEAVEKYKEAGSPSELVPTFYAEGWANVQDGKDLSTSEGAKTVRAWFKDGNELISSSIGSATITLDTTDPEVGIANNNQTFTGETATIQLTLSDNLAGIDYIVVNDQTIDVASLSTKSVAKASAIKAYAEETIFETTISLTEGENTIPVVAYDKAGNSTTTNFIATRTVAAATPASGDSAPPLASPTATTAPGVISTGTETTAEAIEVAATSSSALKISDAIGSTATSVAEALLDTGQKISNAANPFSRNASTDGLGSGAESSGNNFKIIILIISIVVAGIGVVVVKKLKK